MISDKKFEVIKQELRKSCACKGIGCNTCAQKISRYALYSHADIPVVYWSKAMKDFLGDAELKEYTTGIMKDISGFYYEGKSIALVGNLGTGKTYAGCCLLKKACVEGYSAKYIQMVEIVNTLLSKGTDSAAFLELMTSTDFLMIDEFDPRFIFTSEKAEKIFGSTLEYILRTRFQNQMPTVLCSNAYDLDDVLKSDFGRAFSSLKAMYLEEVIVSGKDFRRRGV
jgi:DNA replication protein DnaC